MHPDVLQPRHAAYLLAAGIALAEFGLGLRWFPYSGLGWTSTLLALTGFMVVAGVGGSWPLSRISWRLEGLSTPDSRALRRLTRWQGFGVSAAAAVLAIGPLLTLSVRQSAALFGVALALLTLGLAVFIAYLRILGRLEATVEILVIVPAE